MTPTLDKRLEDSRIAREQFWQNFTLERFGTITMLIALFVFISGAWIVHNGFSDLVTLATDYYANVSSELASIVITVLIVDRLSRQRKERRETLRLFQQVKSHSNAVALDSLTQIRSKHLWEQMLAHHCNENSMLISLSNLNWLDADLKQGNLAEADLSHSNLENAQLRSAKLTGSLLSWSNLAGANLWYANMESSDLESANLTGANLKVANLKNAYLENANLADADLRASNLKGATLRNVNLTGATLVDSDGMWSIKCDEYTMLPDGTFWTEDADLERFTNPDHPEFWQPKNN